MGSAWPSSWPISASSSGFARHGTAPATPRRWGTPPISIWSLVCNNFGIQEFHGLTQSERDVFPGSPQERGGYVYINEAPGIGVDLDEKLAARFPIKDDPSFDLHWGNLRRKDGTIVKP